jgi:hypothetical protein
MGVVTFVLAELFRKIPKYNNKKANFVKILLHFKKSCRKIYLTEVMNEIKKWGSLSAPTSLSIFIKKDKITES